MVQANSREADHSAEKEFGKFLDEVFYSRIATEGTEFRRETEKEKQFAGIDVTCCLSDGREFYFDEKCKVNNLSSPKKVDVIPSIGFELGSLQRQANGERVVKSGWFVADGIKTHNYLIFQAFSTNPDKATVKAADFQAAICARVSRRALHSWVCEKLGTTIDGVAKFDYLMRNTDALKESGRSKIYMSSTVYCPYVAATVEDEGDEEIKGLTVVCSKAIDEQPVNLVIPWTTLIGLKSSKQYYITREGVEVLHNGVNAIDYAKEKWSSMQVAEEPKARSIFSQAQSEASAMKAVAASQARYEKTGITRINKGIYDDIVMESGFFVRDNTMAMVREWLEKYAKALESKWTRDGEQGDRKEQKFYKVQRFIALTTPKEG